MKTNKILHEWTVASDEFRFKALRTDSSIEVFIVSDESQIFVYDEQGTFLRSLGEGFPRTFRTTAFAVDENCLFLYSSSSIPTLMHILDRRNGKSLSKWPVSERHSREEQMCVSRSGVCVISDNEYGVRIFSPDGQLLGTITQNYLQGYRDDVLLTIYGVGVKESESDVYISCENGIQQWRIQPPLPSSGSSLSSFSPSSS
jgi:hypothetical protein